MLTPPTLLPSDPNYSHLFVFLVIFANSLIVDGICYFKILNYMRKNSVRVMMVAGSRAERVKTRNAVTAPASLLIWLVFVVASLPSTLMLLKVSLGDGKV